MSSINFVIQQDLEEALLADGTTGDVPLLTDLIVALLKGCDLVRLQGITTSNYQMFLRRILRKKCNVRTRAAYVRLR